MKSLAHDRLDWLLVHPPLRMSSALFLVFIVLELSCSSPGNQPTLFSFDRQSLFPGQMASVPCEIWMQFPAQRNEPCSRADVHSWSGKSWATFALFDSPRLKL